MKFQSSILLALASTVLSSPVRDESAKLSKRAANAFAVGTKFNIDGSTNYFVGSNSYWISFLNNPSDVDFTMSHVAASGLKVLRVWGFNDVKQATSGDWYQSFIPGQQPQINLGANGLTKLDTVVAAAEKYNVKLIINFVNFWNDYGGIQVYADYYGIQKTAWYTHAAAQTQYKKYIATIVNKHKASTSIFAWELANEPRCPGCATSVITNWATDVSAYIKSLDPNHMVTLGDEGFMNGGGDGSYAYTVAEGIDFVQNLKVPNLDFGTFHLYPQSWNLLPPNPKGNDWFTNHAAACKAANKPCVGEEYGSTSDQLTVLGSWQATALSLKDSGLAGDMFWQWGEQLPIQGTTHNDGYAIYYGSSTWETLVRDHASKANAGGPVTTASATRSTTRISTTTARVSTTTTRVSVTPTTTPRVSTTTPRVTTTPTTSSGGTGTVPRWGQCGGNGYTGPKVCQSPWVCTYSNDWYSQCL